MNICVFYFIIFHLEMMKFCKMKVKYILTIGERVVNFQSSFSVNAKMNERSVRFIA